MTQISFKMILQKLILSIAFSVSMTFVGFSQSFFCSAFSIMNVYPDSINPGDYQLSIQCIAGPNEFASYPVVSSVVDCNGDTVATGGLFYFGQLGQTTQDYPVTLTGNGDINCYPLTASFIINYEPGFTDTCQLTYGSTGNVSAFQELEQFTSYPNPAVDEITLLSGPNFTGTTYTICDTFGKTVLTGRIIAEQTSIELLGLAEGLYFLNARNVSHKIIKQ